MAENIEARHENWMRVVWGLLYVREGLQGYVDTKGKHQYQVFRNNVMGKCNNQTCNQCQVNSKCPNGMTNRSGKSPFRPGHFCDELNREIQNNHVRNKPVWANTDSTKWQDQNVGQWEVIKCYLSTPGYLDKTGPNHVDASGLLSICINSSFINQHISNTQQFEEVRDIRNKTLHDARYELDGQTADDCLDKMVNVLEDPQELIHDTFAKQAAYHIRKIKAKTEKTPPIMNEALKKWLKTNFDVDHAFQEIESQMNEMLRKELKQFIVEEVRKSLDDKSDDTRKSKLKVLQEKLIADILTRYSTIPLNPILQHQNSLLVDFYEPPKMTKTVLEKDEFGKTKTSQKPITKIEEMFISNRFTDGKSPSHLNRVYISGEAGMGKTSFSQYLALAWCAVHGESEECVRMREKMKKFTLFNDVEYLEQTQLLFLLHLREFENESKCKKMLSTYLHSQLGYSERDANELIAVINNPNAVVLIDGLDEWQCSTNQLPEFNGLYQANIVCTSRPWKIESCVTAPTQTYNKITITGIGFDFVERLVNNVTDCLRKEGIPVRGNITDFIKTLRSKELNAILYLRTSESYELLMIPVVILQLLCLWHDYKDFGSTRTQVYVNMADTLLCRMKKKQNAGYRPDTRKTEVSPPLSHLFERLHADYCMDEIENIKNVSKLAFTLMFTGPTEHSFLFKERDLNKNNQRMFQEIKHFCLNSGIVRGTSRKSSSYQDEMYSFIHKSYQEFFAVLHIVAHNCDESVHRDISVNIKSLEDVVELANVFDFVCASDTSCVEAMITLIDNLTTKHTMQTDGDRIIGLISGIQNMLLTACDKYVKENISINLSNLVLGSNHLIIPRSRFGYLPLNILEHRPFRIKMNMNMEITLNGNLNALCWKNISVDGLLDLYHCDLEELVLNNQKESFIKFGKVGRLKRLECFNYGKLATSPIPFQDAKKLSLLHMNRINLDGPMDLSQCPLRYLELDNVQTERLIFGSMKNIERLILTFPFEKPTCIDIHKLNLPILLTHLRMKNCCLLGSLDLSQCLLQALELENVKTERVVVGCVKAIKHVNLAFPSLTTICIRISEAIALTHLSMHNCSMPGPLDFSQCPLETLELGRTRTERVILRCVEECLIQHMFCSYDFYYANNLKYLTMKKCFVSGQLDLSQCIAKRLELENVETEKVVIGCVETIEQLIIAFHSLTTICINIHKAITLTYLCLKNCSISCPLDLSQCPMKKLELTKVETERVIVGCVKECWIYNTSCSYDFTYANKLQYFTMDNCSVSGQLDLSQCPLKSLELTMVKTERVIVRGVVECWIYETSCSYDFTYANNLNSLAINNSSINGPLDLTQCLLKSLELTKVETERVLVRHVEKCTIYDMSCSIDFTLAHNLSHLTIEDFSLPDQLDLSQCPLKKLTIKKVKTERVIVRYVEECRIYNMSCSFDFTDAHNLCHLILEDVSLPGTLDLSHCPLDKINLREVKAEGVIVPVWVNV